MIGLFSDFARVSASGPHGYQSTGLCACCSRYGLVSPASRLVWGGFASGWASTSGIAGERSRRGRAGARNVVAILTPLAVVSTVQGNSAGQPRRVVSTEETDSRDGDDPAHGG